VVADRLLPAVSAHGENGLNSSPPDALVGRFRAFGPARARGVVVFDGCELGLKGDGGPTCLTQPLQRDREPR
jgi:hypothetical protein